MDPSTKRMHDLFSTSKPELLALPDGSLERPRIARERAMQLTTILRGEFEPLLPRLPALFQPDVAAARAADYQALEPRALVFYAADLAAESPWTSDQKASRAELVVKVREHDDALSQWAVPLFRKDPVASQEVADILRGRGIRDDAEDTVRLVALFRRHWANVKGKTPITAAYLEEAERDATALVAILDEAEGVTTGSPKDLRRRAYSWWAEAYQEIFDLGRYLLRADPAAAERLPAISAERSAPEKSPAEPAPAEPAVG
ncbi:MAG TPA: hypothetical protein VLS89_12745 [Candidatus Nanopelagicales bacterium]|nr:hypothetical protein [Candidatus Nanopelagicales bacterium]